MSEPIVLPGSDPVTVPATVSVPYARCAHCAKDVPLADALSVDGPVKMGFGPGGEVYEVRRTLHACSIGCRERVIIMPESDKPDPNPVTEAFRRYSYVSGTWRNSRWLGVPILKNPTDLFVYQEILHEVRPDVVIEAGTFYGGSALFMATIMDAIGHGQVISIDVQEIRGRPSHPRIAYLRGSSIEPAVVDAIRLAVGGQRVLVVLDSAHEKEHVAAEISTYAPLVAKGSYLIVEDTNVDGNPLHCGGPAAAAADFLAANVDFVPDYGREKFLFSYNPGGYLKRVAGGGS